MKALRRILQNRKKPEAAPDVRVFGVGAAKTGTHSIAALFEGSGLVAEHEPNVGGLLELILDRAENGADPETFRRLLREAIDPKISVNVSQINGYVIEDLYAIYPDAKYVLTVRDAEGWVRSLLNHVVTRESETGNLWDRFRRLRFSRGLPFRPEDKWLEEIGFFSLDSLLEYWKDHTLKVLETVPAARLCVVPTTQIGAHKRAIYAFVGIEAGSQPATDHAYQGAYTDDLRQLPAAYVRERCAFYSDSFIRSARKIVEPRALDILHSALYPEHRDYCGRPSQERRDAAARLMADRSTDLDRWAHVARQTDERWDGRAKAAAAMMTDQTSVLDLGCGAMGLEPLLAKGARYVPSDCVRRDERTIVCDLNKDPLPDVEAGCVAALGLFEYIHDLPTLLHTLGARFEVMVCSYIPRETVNSIDERRATGWVNDFSIGEFEALMSTAGFVVTEKRKYLDKAWIWRAQTP